MGQKPTVGRQIPSQPAPNWVPLAAYAKDGVLYELVAQRTDVETIQSAGGLLFGAARVRVTEAGAPEIVTDLADASSDALKEAERRQA
jgi:hypothetical protein